MKPVTLMFLYTQVGKAAFQRHNDPLDAALFYLAMKKKAVLWGLFRCDITHNCAA